MACIIDTTLHSLSHRGSRLIGRHKLTSSCGFVLTYELGKVLIFFHVIWCSELLCGPASGFSCFLYWYTFTLMLLQFIHFTSKFCFINFFILLISIVKFQKFLNLSKLKMYTF